MTGTATEQRIQVGRYDIQYFRAGEQGLPVVLLHGGGTDSAGLTWKLLIEPLAQTYQVYAPNWPCYGGSAPLPDGDTTQETLIDCLDALLNAWGLDQVALTGVSMGGGAAIGYTLEHPDRVARLVPVDSYGLADKAPYHLLSTLMIRLPLLMNWSWAAVRSNRSLLRQSLQSMIKRPGSLTDELIDEVHELAQSPEPQRAFCGFQRSEGLWGGLRTCYMERLGEIRCPTLIIHGAQDTLVPIRAAREAAARIPGARLHVIEQCGHWAPRDCPEEFNEAVLSFLQETEQGAAH